jgi:hypothetical protein
MGQSTAGFSHDTLLRKRIEKRRRQAKDARIHLRLSALLWLDKGYSAEEAGDRLDAGATPLMLTSPVART